MSVIKHRVPPECPSCHADLIGGEIPENIRDSYGPPYLFYRTIGIYCRDRDMTVEWQCPDCNHTWPVKGLPHDR